MVKLNPRVVSLVPSWTEMLVDCGIQVVGRTRYCIHPKNKVSEIKIVGGTKKVNWDRIDSLLPDFVLVDKEENTKEMAEACKYPKLITHVEKLEHLSKTCADLADKLQSSAILEVGERWKKIKSHEFKKPNFSELPGVLKWIKKPNPQTKRIVYLIWKKPWMAVSRDTFIGSVFQKLGIELDSFGGVKYPEIRLEDFNPESTLLLFSSEPYPFEKDKEEISKLPFASAIVDGESFSWFGIRSLEFLENYKN